MFFHIGEAVEPTISLENVTHVVKVQSHDIQNGVIVHEHLDELGPIAFAAAATITPLYVVFGCGALVDRLPYGSALLEESLAFMGNAEDPQKMAPTVRHPKDPFLLGAIPLSYSGGVRTLSSLAPTTPLLPDIGGDEEGTDSVSNNPPYP